MRTQDRTYREAMIHADPDRKTPLHDQTCLYLAHDLRLVKLGQLYMGKAEEIERYGRYLRTEHTKAYAYSPMRMKFKANLSSALRKENGWILGYADVFVQIKYETDITVSYDPPVEEEEVKVGTWKVLENPIAQETMKRSAQKRLLIEVKTQPTSPAAVIQQFNTYETANCKYTDGSRDWDYRLLCTLYPISTTDRDVFLREGIRTIYVDPRSVQAFIDAQAIHEQENF